MRGGNLVWSGQGSEANQLVRSKQRIMSVEYYPNKYPTLLCSVLSNKSKEIETTLIKQCQKKYFSRVFRIFGYKWNTGIIK